MNLREMRQKRTLKINSAKPKGHRKTDRIMVIITLISLIGAYLIGISRANFDIEPYLSGLIDDGQKVVKTEDGIYSVIAKDSPPLSLIHI